MNKQPLMLLSKKVASLVVSVMILLNVFGVVLVNNADNIEISNRYATNTLTKYCNIAVLLPIKIVSSFFKTNISSDIGTSTPIQSSSKNKKSKKDNQKEFFQSAIIEDTLSSVQFYNNSFSIGWLTSQQTIDKNTYTLNFAMLLALLVVVMFSGNMILARGDTEDNIIIKNINKLVRLV